LLLLLAVGVLLVAALYSRAQGGRLAVISSRLHQAQTEATTAQLTARRLEREKSELEQEVATLSARLEKERQKSARLAALAGTEAVTGPGVIIELCDSLTADLSLPSAQPSIVHAIDLLELVSDLANAGAQAVAINNQRVSGLGSISCSGPVVRVNGRSVRSPYVVMAVGDPGLLARAARREGGVIERLRGFGLFVRVTEKSSLTVPALPLPEPEVE